MACNKTSAVGEICTQQKGVQQQASGGQGAMNCYRQLAREHLCEELMRGGIVSRKGWTHDPARVNCRHFHSIFVLFLDVPPHCSLGTKFGQSVTINLGLHGPHLFRLIDSSAGQASVTRQYCGHRACHNHSLDACLFARTEHVQGALLCGSTHLDFVLFVAGNEKRRRQVCAEVAAFGSFLPALRLEQVSCFDDLES